MHLTKHHGSGNDFLIGIDQPVPRDPAACARSWCARRTGIGADGLILAETSPDGPSAMVLYNSDGSRAEISGNGLRCLVQALARTTGDREWEGAVLTDVGLRRGWLRATEEPDRVLVRVEMGTVADGATLDPASLPVPTVAGHVAVVDVGNPHVVVHVADPQAIVLAESGPAIEALVAGGANAHFVMPTSDGALVVTHWERGAGVTSACGSGAVASAYAANSWGVVGDEVSVRMPGGDALVRLGSPVMLEGEVTYVASIEVEPEP